MAMELARRAYVKADRKDSTSGRIDLAHCNRTPPSLLSICGTRGNGGRLVHRGGTGGLEIMENQADGRQRDLPREGVSSLSWVLVSNPRLIVTVAILLGLALLAEAIDVRELPTESAALPPCTDCASAGAEP